MATTTNYSWTTPDNTAYVKDGASAIRTLGSSVDTTLFTALGGAYPGLRLVKKQTIGSGVSSVSVTNAFSATYENYKIIASGGTSSAAGPDLLFNFTGNTSGYNGGLIFKAFNGTTVSGTAGSNQSSWFGGFASPNGGLSINLEIGSPFLSKFATFCLNSAVNNSGGSVLFSNGFHDSTSSFTGFTLTTSTGTLTGGTIYVYGYGAS